MKFNPNARLDTSQVQDRRSGGGGGGMARMPGGKGGLAVDQPQTPLADEVRRPELDQVSARQVQGDVWLRVRSNNREL